MLIELIIARDGRRAKKRVPPLSLAREKDLFRDPRESAPLRWIRDGVGFLATRTYPSAVDPRAAARRVLARRDPRPRPREGARRRRRASESSRRVAASARWGQTRARSIGRGCLKRTSGRERRRVRELVCCGCRVARRPPRVPASPPRPLRRSVDEAALERETQGAQRGDEQGEGGARGRARPPGCGGRPHLGVVARVRERRPRDAQRRPTPRAQRGGARAHTEDQAGGIPERASGGGDATRGGRGRRGRRTPATPRAHRARADDVPPADAGAAASDAAAVAAVHRARDILHRAGADADAGAAAGWAAEPRAAEERAAGRTRRVPPEDRGAERAVGRVSAGSFTTRPEPEPEPEPEPAARFGTPRRAGGDRERDPEPVGGRGGRGGEPTGVRGSAEGVAVGGRRGVGDGDDDGDDAGDGGRRRRWETQTETVAVATRERPRTARAERRPEGVVIL